MRDIASETLSQIDAKRIVRHTLLLFDLASGVRGFWTGLGPFPHNTVTYTGAGKLADVDEPRQVSDGSAVPLTLRLSAIPDSPLTPGVLASFEQEVWHQRPMTAAYAFFHPDSRELLSVEVWFRGYMDQTFHIKRRGGERALEMRVESRARDNTKSGVRLRNDADQQQIAPGDRFCEHSATAGTDVGYWGRNPPSGV